jgi:hypothetical protein
MPSLTSVRPSIRQVKNTRPITKATKALSTTNRNTRGRTTHVIPRNAGWVVTREGPLENSAVVYTTQKEAIEVAREMLNRKAGQIVVHGRDGSIRFEDVHALPAVQPSRLKSSLGTKAIKEAVSAVIRKRLAGG